MAGNYFELSKKRQIELSDLAEFTANEHCPDTIIEPKIIAESHDISFCFGNYEDAFDGLTEHEFGKFHIFINFDRHSYKDSERTRFTFAHELGHYFIDEHRNSLMKGQTPAHPSFTDFSSKNPVEVEADFFAASLLMPRNRIMKDCFRKKFNFQIIQDLSTKYKTSTTATALKFASIGNHPIMIVRSSQNKIDWFRYSHDFPYKWPKGLKTNVPQYTLAGAFFKDGTRYDETLPLTANDWFENVWEKDVDRTFYEKCIYSDRHNFVLSILWED